jgi:hypothetical protein
MRGVISGVVAASLLLGQIANAQACAKPADQTAFDVAGLKSQLMVTALACDVRERYNDFVRRFQPELMQPGTGADVVLRPHFRPPWPAGA